MPQRKKYDDIIADFSALIVEDDTIIALDLEFLLKSLGAKHVSKASRTAQARDMLKAHRYDLCMIDYHLDGGNASSIMKAVADWNLPHVFMSGDRELVRKLGAVNGLHTLEKPFSHKAVKIAVASALGTRLPESARD